MPRSQNVHKISQKEFKKLDFCLPKLHRRAAKALISPLPNMKSFQQLTCCLTATSAQDPYRTQSRLTRSLQFGQ